jgi:uncharacterized protein YdeI (YjbR/CyaY-like superfamily)
MITDVEEFFAKGCGRCARFDTPDCSARHWAEGLAELRRLCLDAGLTETAKWGHPCYMHAGQNIAILGAFRDDLRLTFFNAALLSDPDKVLRAQGANTRHPDVLRFTDAAQIAPLAPIIRAYLAEAMAHAAAGRRPAKETPATELPAELIAALDADPTLAEAFHRLTPGRQRSHGIALSTAKTAATRIARIARLSDKILSGKGATER